MTARGLSRLLPSLLVFAALISRPETEAERVQKQRLRSSIPEFVLHFCGLLGSDALSQNWPLAVGHSCDFSDLLNLQLAGTA